jgi:hypothetical protein
MLSLMAVLIFPAGKLSAQELLCKVQVINPTIQLNNKEILNQLETTIRDFMSRKWTNVNFSDREKIECNILVNVSSVDIATGNIAGTMQVISSRWAYNSNYNLNVFNFLDKNFTIKYVQGQPLEYQEGAYVNELSSLLAYYANIILGYDFDSYSELGGTPYFLKAQAIVNSAQSSSASGWSALEQTQRNRYFLVNDLLDERSKPIRSAIYRYYRQGVDQMVEDNNKGLTAVIECLKNLKSAKQDNPGSLLISLFFESKFNEMVDLFKNATSAYKNQAIELLTDLDVSNGQKYQEKMSANR